MIRCTTIGQRRARTVFIHARSKELCELSICRSNSPTPVKGARCTTWITVSPWTQNRGCLYRKSMTNGMITRSFWINDRSPIVPRASALSYKYKAGVMHSQLHSFDRRSTSMRAFLERTETYFRKMAGNHFTSASLFRQVKAYAACSPSKLRFVAYGTEQATAAAGRPAAENTRLASNSTATAVSSKSRFVRTRAAVVVWTHAAW
jgi:hypothetical protein